MRACVPPLCVRASWGWRECVHPFPPAHTPVPPVALFPPPLIQLFLRPPPQLPSFIPPPPPPTTTHPTQRTCIVRGAAPTVLAPYSTTPPPPIPSPHPSLPNAKAASACFFFGLTLFFVNNTNANTNTNAQNFSFFFFSKKITKNTTIIKNYNYLQLSFRWLIGSHPLLAGGGCPRKKN